MLPEVLLKWCNFFNEVRTHMALLNKKGAILNLVVSLPSVTDEYLSALLTFGIGSQVSSEKCPFDINKLIYTRFKEKGNIFKIEDVSNKQITAIAIERAGKYSGLHLRIIVPFSKFQKRVEEGTYRFVDVDIQKSLILQAPLVLEDAHQRIQTFFGGLNFEAGWKLPLTFISHPKYFENREADEYQLFNTELTSLFPPKLVQFVSQFRSKRPENQQLLAHLAPHGIVIFQGADAWLGSQRRFLKQSIRNQNTIAFCGRNQPSYGLALDLMRNGFSTRETSFDQDVIAEIIRTGSQTFKNIELMGWVGTR